MSLSITQTPSFSFSFFSLFKLPFLCTHHAAMMIFYWLLTFSHFSYVILNQTFLFSQTNKQQSVCSENVCDTTQANFHLHHLFLLLLISSQPLFFFVTFPQRFLSHFFLVFLFIFFTFSTFIKPIRTISNNFACEIFSFFFFTPLLTYKQNCVFHYCPTIFVLFIIHKAYTLTFSI